MININKSNPSFYYIATFIMLSSEFCFCKSSYSWLLCTKLQLVYIYKIVCTNKFWLVIVTTTTVLVASMLCSYVTSSYNIYVHGKGYKETGCKNTYSYTIGTFTTSEDKMIILVDILVYFNLRFCWLRTMYCVCMSSPFVVSSSPAHC